MSAKASQITGVMIIYSTFCSGADQRKHQSSASLAFVRGIHQWPVNSPHKGPVTREKVAIWWRNHGMNVRSSFSCTICCCLGLGFEQLFVLHIPLHSHNQNSLTHETNCLHCRGTSIQPVLFWRNIRHNVIMTGAGADNDFHDYTKQAHA